MNRLILILLCLPSLLCAQPSYYYQAFLSNETVLVTAVQRTNLGLLYWPDSPLNVRTNGSGGYMFYGDNAYATNSPFTKDQSTCAVTSGTLDNPVAAIVTTNTQIANLPASDYAAGGPVYYDAPSQTYIMFYHVENWANEDPVWYTASLWLASGKDGVHFTNVGEIISPQIPFNNTNEFSQDVGAGQYIVASNNVYVPFILVTNVAHNGVGFGMAVCPLASFIASVVVTNTAPVFSKWYNGSFSQPGLGGMGTSLVTGARGNEVYTWASTKYAPFLGLWVTVVAVSEAAGDCMRVWYSTNLTSWFGDDVVRSSNSVVYCNLYSPDGGEGNLGATNYLYGLSCNFSDFWGSATVSRWQLYITSNALMTAQSANAGTVTP